MTALAQRKGPLRLGRAPDLSPSQRMILVALKREAQHPTVRFTYRQLAVLLVACSAVSLGVGFYIGRTI